MAQRLDVQYVQFRTEGNAARKAAPVQAFKTVKLPKAKRQSVPVIRIDPFALAGIVLSAVMVIMLVVGIVQWSNARADAAQMAAYTRYLQRQNEELTTEYHKSYDVADVERTAQALGMVPREQAEHVTLEIPAPEPAQEEPEEISLFESICTFFAGLTA